MDSFQCRMADRIRVPEGVGHLSSKAKINRSPPEKIPVDTPCW